MIFCLEHMYCVSNEYPLVVDVRDHPHRALWISTGLIASYLGLKPGADAERAKFVSGTSIFSDCCTSGLSTMDGKLGSA